MADEPENFMLVLLREIRAKLGEHDKRFDRIDQRFAETEEQFRSLNKKIDDWQETTATGLGFAAHANLRVQNLEQELVEIKERLSRIEGRH